MSENFEEKTYILALENAHQFNGKANPKAVLGKIILEFPKIKTDMKKNLKIIDEITQKVNKLTLTKQTLELKKLSPKSLEKKEVKKEKEKNYFENFSNTEKGVVVRIPPAPSGCLHFGHLLGIIWNFEFKKKFGGKIILRFEDTNPENIFLENYEKIIEDVKWLCENKIDEIFYQSKRLDIYYKILRKLFEKNFAFLCNCKGSIFKDLVDEKKFCPHRYEDKKIQNNNFEKFMKGELENYCLRTICDIENKNPALRTFPLARFCKTKHPNAPEKKIWPCYNLAVCCDDYLMGMTHIIRGKDLEIGEIRQGLIFDKMEWKKPEYFHYGRLKFRDVELSKTELTKKIEEKEFENFEDIRLPTIFSLRKRGYKADAIRNFILSLGLSKRDSKISSKEFFLGLNFFNKQILDTVSKRFFFIEDKIILKIKNLKDISFKNLEIEKHPTNKDFGKRKFEVCKDFFVEKKDFIDLKEGDIIRLMYFGNFKIISKKNLEILVEFQSKEYDKNLRVKKNIHYISTSEKNFEEIKIIMPDNTKLIGVCEILDNFKENESVQFERFGFVKFERLGKNCKRKIFYFTHR